MIVRLAGPLPPCAGRLAPPSASRPVALAAGDGLPREAVSGTVTLDGQMLANGSISFMPPGNRRGPAPAAEPDRER